MLASVQQPSAAVLEEWLNCGWIDPIDYFTATLLLKSQVDAYHAHPLLLALLSAASRQGHLCLCIRNGQIEPNPALLWPQCAESAPAITEWIVSAPHLSHPAVTYDLDRIYFSKQWQEESLLLHHFRLFTQSPPDLNPDNEALEEEVRKLCEIGVLSEEQAAAVRHASAHSLTLLTGGPGTGKTYTAGWMVRLLYKELQKVKGADLSVILAAPTGKAAANLQSSFQKAMEDTATPPFQAKTLHNLLQIKPGKTGNDPTPINCDLIIIDECSMIDVSLMRQLFTSLIPGTRLIMLGDHYQLPPIDAGGLFSDLLEACKSSVIALSQCRRSESSHILSLARSINEGAFDEVLQLLQTTCSDISFTELHADTNPGPVINRLLEMAKPHLIPSSSGFAHSQFGILTPFRKGPFGIEALNNTFFHYFKKDKQPFCAPILIVKNDPKLNLYNGDMGTLFYDACHHPHYAIFKGGEKIQALLLPPYEHAYCLSVHKSQGSEFAHVILLVPEGSDCFGREILYTAVTRAKKKLDIWGAPEIIKRALQFQSKRISGFVERYARSL